MNEWKGGGGGGGGRGGGGVGVGGVGRREWECVRVCVYTNVCVCKSLFNGCFRLSEKP